MSDRRRRKRLRPWLWLSADRFRSVLFVAAVIVPICVLAHAADLDGVQLPSTLQADGKTLLLNGIGLRTYSILGIHIYVAGLYLEQFRTNADEILQSPETKLLTIRFKRNVTADQARDAWRKGLVNNCMAPCRIDPQDIADFIAQVPAMHAGESYSMLFTAQGATVTVDGIELATISKPQFAKAMLATFLGRAPASSRLKAELLQGHG